MQAKPNPNVNDSELQTMSENNCSRSQAKQHTNTNVLETAVKLSVRYLSGNFASHMLGRPGAFEGPRLNKKNIV